MNSALTALISALSIDASSAQGAMVREAMICADVIRSDLRPEIAPVGGVAALLWLHMLATERIKIP